MLPHYSGPGLAVIFAGSFQLLEDEVNVEKFVEGITPVKEEASNVDPRWVDDSLPYRPVYARLFSHRGSFFSLNTKIRNRESQSKMQISGRYEMGT
jgi:hypothetical protein